MTIGSSEMSDYTTIETGMLKAMLATGMTFVRLLEEDLLSVGDVHRCEPSDEDLDATFDAFHNAFAPKRDECVSMDDFLPMAAIAQALAWADNDNPGLIEFVGSYTPNDAELANTVDVILKGDYK